MMGPMMCFGEWILEPRDGPDLGETATRIVSSTESRTDTRHVRVWSARTGNPWWLLAIEVGASDLPPSYFVDRSTLLVGLHVEVCVLDLASKTVGPAIHVGMPIRCLARYESVGPVIVIHETGLAALAARGVLWRWDADDVVEAVRVREAEAELTCMEGSRYVVDLRTGAGRPARPHPG